MAELRVEEGRSDGGIRVVVYWLGEFENLVAEIDVIPFGEGRLSAHFRPTPDTFSFTPWAEYPDLECAVTALAKLYPGVPVVWNVAR